MVLLSIGVAAGEAVGLGPDGVGHVVARHDDVVELPERTVLLHPGHRVVDVVLALYPIGLPAFSELAGVVKLDGVDELILLSDGVVPWVALLVEVELELALLDGVDDVPVEPDALNLEVVRVVIGQILGAVLVGNRRRGRCTTVPSSMDQWPSSSRGPTG